MWLISSTKQSVAAIVTTIVNCFAVPVVTVTINAITAYERASCFGGDHFLLLTTSVLLVLHLYVCLSFSLFFVVVLCGAICCWSLRHCFCFVGFVHFVFL